MLAMRQKKIQEPELHQSLSARINGKKEEWSANKLESFWKKTFVSCMKEAAPNFTIDESNRKIIAALYDYAISKDGLLDPRKGLLLYGPIGVGKSTLLKGIQLFKAKINLYSFGANNPDIGFRIVAAAELSLLYAKDGLAGIERFVDRERIDNLAIDEVGREPIDSKHFGTGLNVVQTILQLRYEQRHKGITHITTNLDPNTDFVSRYDYYIADRVKEMFNVIEIKGDSRR